MVLQGSGAGGQGTDACGDGWCIARTSGAGTLRLVASLAAAGFEAWTPTITTRRRLPRSRERREVRVAIVPTFVFVRSSQLPELVRTRALPVSPHPAFSIFRHGGRVPVIADREIAGFRSAEAHALALAEREARRSHRKAFPVGMRVGIRDAAWTGIVGVVEGGDAKAARISFGGALSVTISTFLLYPDVADSRSSHEDPAALAA